MVNSGQWTLKIPGAPAELSYPKQLRFEHRMEMVKAYVRSDKSVRDLGREARQRKWAKRALTRQVMHLHLGTAIRWLVEHGCLIKKNGRVK